MYIHTSGACIEEPPHAELPWQDPSPPDGCISFLLRLTIGIAKVTFKRNMIYPSPRRDVIETKKDTQKGLHFFSSLKVLQYFIYFSICYTFCLCYVYVNRQHALLSRLLLTKYVERFVISLAANKTGRTLFNLICCLQNRQNALLSLQLQTKQAEHFLISFAAYKIGRTLCYLFSCKQNRQNTF